MEETLQKIQDLLAVYGIKVLAALLILLIGRMVARLITGLIRRLCTKKELDPTVVSFLCNLTYIALMLFVIPGGVGTTRYPDDLVHCRDRCRRPGHRFGVAGFAGQFRCRFSDHRVPSIQSG